MINLKTSNFLCAILLFSTSVAILSILIVLKNYPWMVVSLPFILFFSFYILKKDCLLQHDKSIIAAERLADSKWHLINKLGESFHFSEARSPVLSRWFIILYLKCENKNKTLIISFDSISETQYKMLISSLWK